MKIAIRVIFLIFLVSLVGLFSVGCGIGGIGGGANIRLEGLSLGAVTMDGKPVTGLPSDKISLLLEVSAQNVLVRTSADGITTLTISPSGGTIEIKADGVSIKGIKPEQIKVEWAAAGQD
jgi:hypothetical protein